MNSFALEVSVVREVHAEEEERFCDCYCLDDERDAVCCCLEAIEDDVQDTV